MKQQKPFPFDAGTIDPDDFDTYEDYLEAVGEFKYEPVSKVRDGFPGENVFFNNWKKLLDEQEFSTQLLEDILRNFPIWITQRHATVVTSVITWLGTNCGQSILYEAERIKEFEDHDRYLLAWAKDNCRKNYMNNGGRVLEYLLCKERNEFTINLEAADYEAAEQLMVWLARDEGQKFLKKCKDDLDGEYKRARDEAHTKMLKDRQARNAKIEYVEPPLPGISLADSRKDESPF